VGSGVGPEAADRAVGIVLGGVDYCQEGDDFGGAAKGNRVYGALADQPSPHRDRPLGGSR
jgi:hypothetical protein